MTSVFSRLHGDCAALGTRLFTVTSLDEDAALYRRVYSSHPAEYPVSGTKPLDRDAWYDLHIAGRQPFIANTPEVIAQYFFDHELIGAMGLGSCLNLTVHEGAGPVLGTVNLLAETGHYTADRIAAYQGLIAAALPLLCAALPAALLA